MLSLSCLIEIMSFHFVSQSPSFVDFQGFTDLGFIRNEEFWLSEQKTVLMPFRFLLFLFYGVLFTFWFRNVERFYFQGLITAKNLVLKMKGFSVIILNSLIYFVAYYRGLKAQTLNFTFDAVLGNWLCGIIHEVYKIQQHENYIRFPIRPSISMPCCISLEIFDAFHGP